MSMRGNGRPGWVSGRSAPVVEDLVARPRAAHIYHYHSTNALDGGANQVTVAVDGLLTEARG
jgi:hypothetical protein